MNKNSLLMSLTVSAFLLNSSDASAQNRNCADHDAVVTRLAERFSESRQVIALNGDNSVLEVFASEDTGTWTITITKAGGLTCIVAAGQNYQHVAEAVPNTDSGA